MWTTAAEDYTRFHSCVLRKETYTRSWETNRKMEKHHLVWLILISAVTIGWYGEKIKAWIPPDLYQWFLSRSINCALNATVFLSNVVDHAHPFMITASNGSSSRMAWTTSLRSVSCILNHKEFRQLRSQ